MLTVNERIRAALPDLKERPPLDGKALDTVGDLLKPPEEFSGGFVAQSLRLERPRFIPRPRRSSQPLTLPRTIEGRIVPINSGVHTSVQAIWQWYEQTGKADPKLLEAPMNDQNFYRMLGPLEKATEDYYPMGSFLECIGSVTELEGIWLTLPAKHYDEEDAGWFEAFLTDASAVAGLLHRADSDLDEPLIKEVGYVKLVEHYAAYKGEKTWDSAKTFDWYKSFFAHLEQKYPHKDVGDMPILATDLSEIKITEAEDIDFALDWGEAYNQMTAAMPDTWGLEYNENGQLEEFIQELCRVWRLQ